MNKVIKCTNEDCLDGLVPTKFYQSTPIEFGHCPTCEGSGEMERCSHPACVLGCVGEIPQENPSIGVIRKHNYFDAYEGCPNNCHNGYVPKKKL